MWASRYLHQSRLHLMRAARLIDRLFFFASKARVAQERSRSTHRQWCWEWLTDNSNFFLSLFCASRGRRRAARKQQTWPFAWHGWVTRRAPRAWCLVCVLLYSVTKRTARLLIYIRGHLRKQRFNLMGMNISVEDALSVGIWKFCISRRNIW